ncbi:MAG: SH3 domain-containing protein [Candidatus Rokubacteria bacterium]|nr:SH3 domain-containing protein [Candidatus Rokubacteria bacterium]MBI3108410.1 SH3 domain-containing protein [Candidatus Rokubacteria bacterium]
MRTQTAPQTTDSLRWVVALLALLGAATLPAQETDAGPQRFVRVKVDTANLRARPSLKAEKVRDAYENEPLHVVGRQGRWLEVRDVTGEAAWIYAPLTDGRPAVVVVRDVVNVREGPGTGHPIAFTAERSVNLLVLDRAGRWLHVQHEVGEGWLHDSLVWGPP